MPLQVGTLVGRFAPGKDLVLQALRAPDRVRGGACRHGRSPHAVQPPPALPHGRRSRLPPLTAGPRLLQDSAAPLTVLAPGVSSASKKGGSKGGKAAGGGLQLDNEWVVEHAAMVERLLPGGERGTAVPSGHVLVHRLYPCLTGLHGHPLHAGLDVVGLYVVCPAAAFAAAGPLLASLAEAAAKELSGRLPSLLVLHVDAVTGAVAAREAGPGSLRPAEHKAAPLLDQMVQLQSRCGRWWGM